MQKVTGGNTTAFYIYWICQTAFDDDNKEGLLNCCAT